MTLCGHADRLLIAGRVGVAHVERELAGVTLLLDDREQVGEGLERVVQVALHVEDRRAAGFRNRADVLVADAPVDVADRDAVVVAAEDLADLLPRVAVADLRARGVEEHGVSAELGHAGLEARTGAGAREEEQHGEDLVPQQRMRLTECALALEVEGDIDDRVEFVLGPFLGRDHVATVQICLHQLLLCSPRACRWGSCPASPADEPESEEVVAEVRRRPHDGLVVLVEADLVE